MSATLSDRIRRARNSTVEVNGRTFHIRRPTDIEMAELYKEGDINKHHVARDFVIGWIDVKESDLLAGSKDDPVEFDREAWELWCDDDMTLWTPIYQAVMESYVQHANDRDEAAKN